MFGNGGTGVSSHIHFDVWLILVLLFIWWQLILTINRLSYGKRILSSTTRISTSLAELQISYKLFIQYRYGYVVPVVLVFWGLWWWCLMRLIDQFLFCDFRFDLVRHEMCYNAIKLAVFPVFLLNCALSLQAGYWNFESNVCKSQLILSYFISNWWFFS
jgi:hypothetical protein